MKVKLIIVSCALLLMSCYSYRSGEEFATFQKENSTFVLRVTALTEKTFFFQTLSGAYYIFETKAKNEADWREIMVFRDDDPLPINEHSIQFLNERIAFAYMGWMYAVTTDGGETWSVWNGQDFHLEEGRMGFDAIQDIHLFENGQGLMKLRVIGGSRDVTILRTNDYGVSWIEDGKIDNAKNQNIGIRSRKQLLPKYLAKWKKLNRTLH